MINRFYEEIFKIIPVFLCKGEPHCSVGGEEGEGSGGILQ